MCIANDYAYFNNYDYISGHSPDTHVINTYIKSGLTQCPMDIETCMVILLVSHSKWVIYVAEVGTDI